MLTPSLSSLLVGQPKKFTLTAIYGDNSTNDVTRLATWSCSDTTDTNISSDGLLTSFATGEIALQVSFEARFTDLGLKISEDHWTPWDTR
jgi:hypothetical protein